MPSQQAFSNALDDASMYLVNEMSFTLTLPAPPPPPMWVVPLLLASAAAGMIIVGFAILARYLKLPDAADTLGGASSMAMPVFLTIGSMLLTGRLIFGRWSQHAPTINAIAFGIRTAGTFVAMALGGVLLIVGWIILLLQNLPRRGAQAA